MLFEGQHILSADQFDRQGLEELFALAHRMRPIEERKVQCHVLEGYVLGSWFFKESTRTRLSGETAFRRLGGGVNTMTDMKMSAEVKGESFEDSIRVLSAYCDVEVVRCKETGQAAIAAQLSRVPVINGGDGSGEHPTQALLDVFTIQEELGRIDGLTVTMMGDLHHGRTVHSLAKLLSVYHGIRLVLCAPDLLPMPAALIEEIESKGVSVELAGGDKKRALNSADVVYVVRPQVERMTPEEQASLKDTIGPYGLDRQLVERYCKPGVVIMHPLPRNSEIKTDVDDLPGAAYFRQVDNGILVRMALFIKVLGKEEKFI